MGMRRRKQDVLRDVKWKRFLKLSRRFRHIPFVDFVFAAGSMALGNVHVASDFDVLVGCRSGRIFTARFFSIFVYTLTDERRKRISHHEDASDKICFNHFVTEKSMELKPPYNIYWQELYKNLVPLYGQADLINRFWLENSWMGEGRVFYEDLRHSDRPSYLKKFLEFAFQGRAGDWLEAILRKVQVRRIEQSLKRTQGFAPRIIYNDEELEFHPDTKRIHSLIAEA